MCSSRDCYVPTLFWELDWIKLLHGKPSLKDHFTKTSYSQTIFLVYFLSISLPNLRPPYHLTNYQKIQGYHLTLGVGFLIREIFKTFRPPGFELKGKLFLKMRYLSQKISKINPVKVQVTREIWKLLEPLRPNGAHFAEILLKECKMHKVTFIVELNSSVLQSLIKTLHAQMNCCIINKHVEDCKQNILIRPSHSRTRCRLHNCYPDQ